MPVIIRGLQFCPWIDVRGQYEVAIFFIQHLFRISASYKVLNLKFQILSNYLLGGQES
jgi:hypothetical protein